MFIRPIVLLMQVNLEIAFYKFDNYFLIEKQVSKKKIKSDMNQHDTSSKL